VTFHRSARTFVRQLLSPLLISALLVAVLLPIDLFTKNMNIVLSVLLKGAIFAIVYGTYIQLTGEYDLIGKAKTIINRNNNARA
jgi:teichuronic acid exporter